MSLKGPTILFNNKKKKFYACSACRDRKLCPFYADHHENKKFSSEKLANWLQIYSMGQRSYLDTRERYKSPYSGQFNSGFITIIRLILKEKRAV